MHAPEPARFYSPRGYLTSRYGAFSFTLSLRRRPAVAMLQSRGCSQVKLGSKVSVRPGDVSISFGHEINIGLVEKNESIGNSYSFCFSSILDIVPIRILVTYTKRLIDTWSARLGARTMKEESLALRTGIVVAVSAVNVSSFPPVSTLFEHEMDNICNSRVRGRPIATGASLSLSHPLSPSPFLSMERK